MARNGPFDAGEPGPGALSDARPLYRGESGRRYHEEKRGLRPEAREWVFRFRAEKFQKWIGAEDRVFEFGSGAGWNLIRLRCGRRIGCDAAEFLAEGLRERGIDFVSDVESVAEESVDVVICHQTLEHVLEPVNVLREFARVLVSAGRLILHVPWERETRYARFDPEEPNHHLYHWNAQNLGNLVTVLGWQIEALRVRRYGYDRFAANWAARLRVGEFGFRVLRSFLVGMRPLREVELVARRPK